MKRFKLVAVVMLGLLVTGCIGGFGQRADVGVYMVNSGGSEGEASVSSLAALGLEAGQTDEKITEVWVTITGVEVKRDGKWETIAVEQQGEINLMELQFQQMLLGQAKIPAGTYTEIRFQIAKEGNYIVFEGGGTAPLNIPSGELKPHIGELHIPAGTVTELVFDVNTKYFAERAGGVFNINPRQSLRFVQAVEAEFGELNVSIQLPEGIDKFVSAQISLFRDGETEPTEPIWITELEDNVLELKISYLPPGKYRLEASVTLGELLTLELSAGPIEVKAGQKADAVLLDTEI